MAVDAHSTGQVTAGRRFLVGTNVVLTVILVVGIVAVVQAIAFSAAARVDMTSSRVNSLSEGSENLLRSLDSNIRLTSLYFETDREEEDQQRYRRAAQNLLDLYEATNRAKVTGDWINPLKDHEKLQALKARLREKGMFKAGIEAHKERIDAYVNTIDAQVSQLVKAEVEQVQSLASGIGDSSAQEVLAPVETLLLQWSSELELVRTQIEASTTGDDPQYSAAVRELKSHYRKLSQMFKDIGAFGTAQVARNPGMAEAEASFLRGAGNRYASVVADVEVETTKLEDLETLKLDDVLLKLGPTSNAILVETDGDAAVVDFGSVWPPVDQRFGPRASFKQRAFKGEQELTSAILRATHQEQTAVIFVRYGGMPLFSSPMPNRMAAPYAATKEHLEDTNFVVGEWDLKQSDTPAEIDPAPTRTIFVVLKPTPPQQGQMGQPSNDPPFTDHHRQLLVGAMGDNPRALFIGGWWPGPFGVMPGSYEYNDYLKDVWGVSLDTSALLLQTTSLEPGKYNVVRRDWFSMDDLEVAEHDIVKGLGKIPVGLPWCAPLELSGTPPDGVALTKLITQPSRDGLWGIKNINKYEEQMRSRQYLTKEEGDLEGPFDLAVAAAKDDGEKGKIVVISGREFAVDNVAFGRQMAVSPQGITFRLQNPGNVTLLVNSLHWLNDNTDFMNIGKPIDAAVLAVDRRTVGIVQVLTIFVWPVLALGCGGVAWWMRRR